MSWAMAIGFGRALRQVCRPTRRPAQRALSVLSSPPPPGYTPFRLHDSFVAEYARVEPEFGFNGLGKLVFERTYSRPLGGGRRERWFETVERVVNGTFNMQKQWLEHHELRWDAGEMQDTAQDMYERIFTMKFLPPGRGLWAMGTPITEERRLFAALNNCAFVSTDAIEDDFAAPFAFLMEAAMLGVGVGFDTRGAHTILVRRPTGAQPLTYVIADSREGWVGSLRALLESYAHGSAPVEFDYSLVRPAGSPIRGFGGIASGPGPLRELHETARAALERNVGQPVSVTTIVDIMNLVGKCVVAGNVRRTAEIAFGDPRSDEYIDLKNYEVNPQRMSYGWTSNNSVFAELGMDYSPLVRRIVANGEPGFAWLDNMRSYGRMNGVPDRSDWRASGGNPCLEQTLESFELCCLVETFPAKHTDLEDFKRTLDAAFHYAKTVTLGETQWPATNAVMRRNRRIGCSISGVAQFISSRGLGELREWCEAGYGELRDIDAKYSHRFGIPRSVKLTSVKPSGSVSLLAGATPGLHFPESRFYVRRMRLPRLSPLVERLVAAGLTVEPAVGDEEQTLVVEFPVDAGEGVRSVHELSMWEQLSLAAFLQRHWADNQVSCTVTFDPETEASSLASALDYFQYQLKGVSFLPRLADATAYPQMPYEKISEEEYEAMMARVRMDVLYAEEREQRGAGGARADACAGADAGAALGAPGGRGASGDAAGAGGAEWAARGRKPAAPPSADPTADEQHAMHAADHTPDIFCDSDRCVQEEVRSIARSMSASGLNGAGKQSQRRAAAAGGGGGGSLGSDS